MKINGKYLILRYALKGCELRYDAAGRSKVVQRRWPGARRYAWLSVGAGVGRPSPFPPYSRLPLGVPTQRTRDIAPAAPSLDEAISGKVQPRSREELMSIAKWALRAVAGGSWVVLMVTLHTQSAVQDDLLSAQRRVPDAEHTVPVPLKGDLFYGTASDARTVARTRPVAVGSVTAFLLSVAAMVSAKRRRAE